MLGLMQVTWRYAVPMGAASVPGACASRIGRICYDCSSLMLDRQEITAFWNVPLTSFEHQIWKRRIRGQFAWGHASLERCKK